MSEPDGGGVATRPHRRGGGDGHAGTASIAARTSSRVSHSSGARTLAICGAKTGEWQTTSRAGPSAMISPSASTIARSATLRGQFDVVRRQHDRVARPDQLAQHDDEPVLTRIVEAAGRFVEQEKRWCRGEDHGERERESLAFREIARMAVHRHPREDPRQGGQGRSRLQGGGAVGAATLVFHGFAVEEQPGILWHQSNGPDQLVWPQTVRVAATRR